jgi:hypothetical protein
MAICDLRSDGRRQDRLPHNGRKIAGQKAYFTQMAESSRARAFTTFADLAFVGRAFRPAAGLLPGALRSRESPGESLTDENAGASH